MRFESVCSNYIEHPHFSDCLFCIVVILDVERLAPIGVLALLNHYEA